MSYKINPAVYGSMFGIPCKAVDDYLKLIGPVQLKSLIWIFRHNTEPIDPEEIGKAIGRSASDVSDALTGLCEWGFISSDSQPEAVQPKPQPEAESSPVKKVLPENKTAVKPSYEQILKRCKESPQINDMFNDIQEILGKTIGYDAQSVLITMHDLYGLPFEVIYMIVDYCVSIGKSGFAYIEKVGRDWGEREIDTIEKADEQIKILNSCNGIWKQFAAMAGIQNPRPTASQSEYLKTWSVELKYGVDMIYHAYEEMLDHSSKISFAYMNKILINWHAKGLRTPADVERDKREFRESGKKGKAVQTQQTSYDMNEFNRRADKLPVYKKGE